MSKYGQIASALTEVRFTVNRNTVLYKASRELDKLVGKVIDV